MCSKKKKYIVTHSNYTEKKVHKSIGGNRTVYERDFAILTDNGSWNSDGAIYGSPTFKMVSSNRISEGKKYKYGNWVRQHDCNNDAWTLEYMVDPTGITEESKITIKPNSNSLLDFAYYGSCTELIRTTITNIIENFPGEISIISGICYNPFKIDLISENIPLSLRESANELRYFCKSAHKYVIISGNNETAISSWEVTDIVKNKTCYTEGDTVCKIKINGGNYFDVKFINGEFKLTSTKSGDIRIRPMQSVIDEYFANLDDFERIVLNTTTNPLYTMELDYPHETDYGISTYRKVLTWPTKNGYNLDFESGVYERYLNDLLKLADFYDNRKTNNLWRGLVHDSIKNMDLTYIHSNSNDDSEDYSVGTTKMEGLLMAYGRQFDEIKKTIDNFKSVNNITYDGNNNISPYFLSDKLEMSGWEVYSVAPSDNPNVGVSGLYTGNNKFYNSTDANIEFMKNLQINSKDILARKGTRNGIEMLLSLFGLKSYDFVKLWKKEDSAITTNWDYKISEYVNVVTGCTPFDDVEEYNSFKKTFEYESDESENFTNTLQGLPVREVVTESGSYLIPWFDKLEDIDGKPYFQMYGGWGKMPRKKINGEVTELVSSGNNVIYDETCKYIKVVKRIKDLAKVPSTVKNGDIYFVSDISDFDEVYSNKSGVTPTTLENASNYFIIKDTENHALYGELNDGSVGWINIPQANIDNATGDGFKVLYIESIIDDYKGNNSHCGFGRYDDGAEYLRYFKQLFKYSIENDNFTEEAYDCNGLLSGITEAGFSGLFNSDGSINYIEDNMKTWYFTDEQPNDSVKELKKISGSTGISMDNVTVGSSASGFTWRNSSLVPHNFESGGARYDEAASYSIINNKRMVITFSSIFNSEEGYDYLIKCILPFLKQMIPSTTLFEIKVGGNNTAQ